LKKPESKAERQSAAPQLWTDGRASQLRQSFFAGLYNEEAKMNMVYRIGEKL
jgi:hypothetical protein